MFLERKTSKIKNTGIKYGELKLLQTLTRYDLTTLISEKGKLRQKSLLNI